MSDKEQPIKPSEPGQAPEPGQAAEPASFFDSVWPGAGQKAWGLWDSVKSSPAVQQGLQEANERIQQAQKQANERLQQAQKQANERLQQAQKQANEALGSYDPEALKQRLAQLGRSATEYIDNADRKLEEFENRTAGYIQQEGSKLAERVRETAHDDGKPAEVLFNGPEKKPVSRLDAELMALHASPDRFLEQTSGSGDEIPADERKNLLASSTDLSDTYKLLVPVRISEPEFWKRYAVLKTRLVNQDTRRKQLIERQGTPEDDQLDDWGSSEDESTPVATEKTTKKQQIQEEGSDDDWE